MRIHLKIDFNLSSLYNRAKKRVSRELTSKSKSIYELFIPIAIVLFVIAIVALFFAYRQSNQAELPSLNQQLSYSQNVTEKIEIEKKIAQIKSWPSQIWSFSGTETFKTIAVSILLTALLAALGKLFKIKEALDERIRAQRQIRIGTQIKCIDNTEKMWDELYCMVSAVRFYDKNKIDEFNKDPNLGMKDKKKSIEELLTQSENFASRAEEVLNQWYFVFPILPKICEDLNREYMKELHKIEKKKNKALFEKKSKDIDYLIWRCKRPSEIIVFFINVLYDATMSVAYYIKEIQGSKSKKYKLNEMQNALGVIQDVIDNLTHQCMLAVLKCTVEPQEGYSDQEQYDINRENIKMYLNILFENCIKMKNKIKDIPPLPRIIDMNDNYLKGYISCLTIMETDAACELSTKENQICNLFNESLETINESDIAKAWEFKYSEHTLPKLAKQLAIIYLEEEIKDKNRWFSLINTVPDVK